MTDFDKWYEKQFHEVPEQLLEFCRKDFKLAYEAGAASQAQSKTTQEVLDVMDEEPFSLSKLERIFKNDERVRAEGGLASNMTLREHYAGQALIALVHEGDMALDDVASLACHYSGKMLKALKEPEYDPGSRSDPNVLTVQITFDPTQCEDGAAAYDPEVDLQSVMEYGADHYNMTDWEVLDARKPPDEGE
jgi:hypothetical protein